MLKGQRIDKLGPVVALDGHPDANALLRTGHAVVRVLAAAEGEADAYPALLEAIGTSLGSPGGAMWLRVARGTLRRAFAWGAAPDGPADGLSFEVPRIGVMNFAGSVTPTRRSKRRCRASGC